MEHTPQQEADFAAMRAWLDEAHPQLAAGARAGYAHSGRGLLLARLARQPGTTDAVDWVPLEVIPVTDATATVIRMVEDYDPAEHFVIVLAIAGSTCCMDAKVRLDSPTLVVPPSRAVH